MRQLRIGKRGVSRLVAVLAGATLVVGMTASAGMARPKPRLAKPTLTASVPARTNATTATFTFSSPTATKYTCSLDGKKTTCTSPKTYTALAERAHAFSVVATRTGARASQPASFAWTVDRTAPPAVTFTGVPTAPVKAANAPDVRFLAGEANDTFSCRVDNGAPFACSANTAGSTQTQAATSNGTHTLTVTPTDAAGNVGPAASAGWTIDDVGPTVVISDPPGTNPLNTVTVHFTVVGADDVSNHPVVCTLTRGGVAQTAPVCDAFGNGAGQLDVATPSDGAYVLTITASDPVGNTGSAQASWTRSAAATAPPVLSGPAAYINDASSVAARITWTVNGTDTYSCKVDSAAAAPCATPGSFDPPGVGTDGSHTVAVVDTTGTPSSPALWTWTLDTVAPSLTVIGGPSARSNASSATFGITADSGSGAPLLPVVCTFTKGATTLYDDDCPADGTFDADLHTAGIQPLTDGSYSLAVAAMDAAGNAKTVNKSWVVDRTAPAATITGLASLTGPIRLGYAEPVSGLTTGAVALTLTDTGATVPTMSRCRNAAGGAVSCIGAFRTLLLTPARALLPGQHYTLVIVNAAVHDMAGNVSAGVTRAFRGQLTLAENSVAAVPSWQRTRAKTSYGGSYVREHLAGAMASYRFRGTSVSWLTVTGPDQGKALVRVDGHRKGVVNNYAAARHYRVARTFRHLGRGNHVLTVTVLGRKGARAGRGTFVSVDAMKVGTTVVKSPALAMTWHRLVNAKLFGGRAGTADLAGETYVLRFRGTSVAWRTMTSRTQGKARVYVDGVLKSTVDNFSAAARFHIARTVSGLVDRPHTLRIVVTGTHHRGGRGTTVTVDGFRVG